MRLSPIALAGVFLGAWGCAGQDAAGEQQQQLGVLEQTSNGKVRPSGKTHSLHHEGDAHRPRSKAAPLWQHHRHSRPPRDFAHHHTPGDDCDVDAPTGCAVVDSQPGFDAQGVSIVAEPRLSFDGAVDPSEIASALRLKPRAGGPALPVRVVADGSRSVRIVPEHELAFFADYSLELGARTLAHGRQCRGFSTRFSTAAPEFPATLPLPGPVQSIAELGALVVTGHYGSRELSVYERTAGAPQFQEHLALPGPPLALSVVGSRLYAAMGKQGVAVLVARRQSLSLRAQLAIPGDALSVAPLAGSTARIAVGLRAGGAALLDVVAPDAPVLLATIAGDTVWPTLGLASTVRQGRALLALAEDEAGVRLFDVSNVSAPTLLQQHVDGRPQQLQFQGELLLVTHIGYPRLSVYGTGDISRQLSRVTPCNEPCTWNGDGFESVGRQVFFGTRQGGVRVADLRADGQLSETGQVLSTGGTEMVLSAASWASGGPVLVGDDRGLFAFGDLDAPAAGPGRRVLGDAIAVARQGDYAYVIAGFAGLQVFALEPDREPRWLGTQPTPGGALAHDIAGLDVTALSGGRLLVSDARAGVTFYDLSQPAEPRPIASFTDDFDASGQAVQFGDVAYVCDGNSGFEVFDLSDPQAPARMTQVTFAPGPFDGCNALLVDSERELLLLGAQRGVYMYDLSEPLAPRLLGTQALELDAIVIDMLRSGDDLWLATYARLDFAADPTGVTRRVERWSIADGEPGGLPLTLRQRWRSEALGATQRLTLAGHTLFVAGGPRLYVFDTASRSTAPYATLESLSTVRGLLATENGLYAARGPGGFGRISTGPLPLPITH